LAGKSRPEEGSEHTFFYTIEHLTRRNFVHGQAVATGIFVSSHYQRNDEDKVGRAMSSMGLVFRPREYGVRREEFVDTLLKMKSYSEKATLPFSILNLVEITRRDAETFWQELSP
jgi:glycerol dehydrogenase-like iron-containing ADH family enzyme